MAVCTIDRTSPSPQDSESEEVLSLSSREGFVCREGCVFSLSPRPGVSVGKQGAMPLRIMSHLKKVVKLMRAQDSLKLAVELEQNTPRNVSRYMSLITTLGLQDTEESIILGTEQGQDNLLICLVLPLLRDTEIKLNGDGGFSVHSYDKQYNFKPCSVQSMWTVLQSMFKAIEQARTHNYFVGGLSHTWMTYYRAQLTDDGVALNEWSIHSDIETFRPDSPIFFDATGGELILLTSEKESFRKYLATKLREIMLHCDLEMVTSKQLRIQLEEELKMDLKEYRGYLDQQMLIILGQMEKPSRIHDYLYLGSEWNAADLVGLKEIGIGYILNVTKEIDNFYPEVFKYKSIRLYDVPESELLMHWESTYKFIKEAKESNSKVLVHCKMGISRSAATTIAFTMKEYRMSLDEAFKHVKSCRTIINPNHGFMSQLKSYEGILTARYNERFGAHVPSRMTYQSRCGSDNSIRQKLFVNGDDATSGKDGSANEQEINGNKQCETSEEIAMNNDSQSQVVDQALENKVVSRLPPEKVHGMMNYLASLPGGEEDQDLGIMVPSPSESGSPFSSPLLTPPDIEGMQLMLKDFQEAEKDRLEREKLGQESSEGKDLLTLPHTRVGRAVSLPTNIQPRSYPRSTPLPEKDENVKELSEETTPDGDIKIMLKQSVTDRVKEIEKKNSSLRSERPASAGSRKHMSSCLSMASSEESISSKKVASMSDEVSSQQKDNKRRSTSPVNSMIPECDLSMNDESGTLLSIGDASPMSPSTAYKIATQTSQVLTEQRKAISTVQSPEDSSSPIMMTVPSGSSEMMRGDEDDMCIDRECMRDVRSESPPPSSTSSYLYMNVDNNHPMDTDSIKSTEIDSLLLRGSGNLPADESPIDPAKQYELARQRSLLLEEVKRNKTKQSLNSNVKGVRQLCSVFGEKSKGSSLKRTQSLKEDRPIAEHKRTSSVSGVTSEGPSSSNC